MDLPKVEPIFTTLLLGRSQSGAPFRDVFSILVALSLGAVLQLSSITPGGSKAEWYEGTQSGTEITKKNYKNRFIVSIITSKDFLSVKIHKFKINKKFLKTTLLRTSRSVGGAKRIPIQSRNLQIKITVFL